MKVELITIAAISYDRLAGNLQLAIKKAQFARQK